MSHRLHFKYKILNYILRGTKQYFTLDISQMTSAGIIMYNVRDNGGKKKNKFIDIEQVREVIEWRNMLR